MVIPIRPEWNDFIAFRPEWSFQSGRNGMISFHSGRNGELIPFWLEWNGHSIPPRMEWSHPILSGMEWALHSSRNGHSNPAGMECHSFDNLKKYAPLPLDNFQLYLCSSLATIKTSMIQQVKTGSGIIQTDNVIISPTSRPLQKFLICSNLLLK